MKQNLWVKVIAGLIGLGLALFGISVLDADPTLRVMQEVSITDIEAGRMPRDGQQVRISDAWLLPTWVVEYSHSRKRGDHTHVTVGLGSRAAFERAVAGEVTDVKLWLRLSQDFRTREAATAAMNREELYRGAKVHDGVINELPDSVRESLPRGGPWTSQATMRLEEGASPSTKGDGAGMLAAGVLVLMLVGAWLLIDRINEAWAQGLASSGSVAFQGSSPWLLAFALAVLLAPVFAFIATGHWVDNRQLDGVAWAFVLGLAALAGLALWRNRVALVATPQGLARAGHGETKPLLRWDEVDTLSLEQRSFRGTVRATYTLHAGERKHKVGNSLFAGGVHAHEALGRLLRDEVNRRVAPGLLRRLASGERVSFGALGASRDGLIKGRLETGEVLPWSEIDSTALNNGKLRIKRKGKLLAWENVAMGKLRNPDVLLNLIQQQGLPPASAG